MRHSDPFDPVTGPRHIDAGEGQRGSPEARHEPGRAPGRALFTHEFWDTGAEHEPVGMKR